MSQEAITVIIIAFILFVLFPLVLALAKKIEPVTYNKDVIKKAYKLIEAEQELRAQKERDRTSFEDMGGGM